MSKTNAAKKVRLPSKVFKRLTVKTMMFCLGRAFPSLVKGDEVLLKEISEWPVGFTIMFEIEPFGPWLSMQRTERGMRFMGLKKTEADLAVCIKNIDSAFLLFTGMMGTPKAYAEHRVYVKGHVADALRLIRCLNRVLFYLFPTFVARRLMKRLPHIRRFRLFVGRAKAYLVGVPFGI